MLTVYIHEDQLTPRHAALEGLGPRDARVLMVESVAHARRLPFHKQRIVLVWRAMRHFADELRARGFEVDYHELAADFDTAIAAHVRRCEPRRLRLMQTAEWGVHETIEAAFRKAAPAIEIERAPNNMFLSDPVAFAGEARRKKRMVMEDFYRNIRRETGLLMNEDGEPVGGRWNYDHDNREPPPREMTWPPIPTYPPDAVTRELMDWVDRELPRHFGRVRGFALPTSRADAEHFFEDFLDNRLDLFGPYEDAMVAGQWALHHALVSPLMNIGLLEPPAMARAAEARYRAGRARLNSVEGFIRQIVGWREFVCRIYHLHMPGYTERNELGADIPVPDFYWTAETDMACIREAVSMLLERGINHHIIRLMITGNFALIAGLNPQAVNRWYWLAYVDAWEWVVSPNVLGMALYADGGLLATKPYAASANYINRMSDYCRGCRYNPRAATGEHACPFNALYWDFLARHHKLFADNARMNLVIKQLERRAAKDLPAIRRHAAELRRRLRANERI